MRSVLTALVWVCVAAAMAGFVLPWALVDVREPSALTQLRESAPGQELLGALTKRVGRITAEVRRGAETVTGELPDLEAIPRQISGAQIPRLANQQNTRAALAVAELLMGRRQHLGAKSYAVYLLPGLALLCALLVTFLGRARSVILGSAAVCAAVSGAGFWKLLTADTQALFIAVTIGPGLWLSLWAYAGLAAASGLLALVGGARARP
jgi:hypothetical protein